MRWHSLFRWPVEQKLLRPRRGSSGLSPLSAALVSLWFHGRAHGEPQRALPEQTSRTQSNAGSTCLTLMPAAGA